MNLIEELKLLFKLKKLLKNFDMKNWKTSLAGLLGFAVLALPKMFPNPIVLEVCTVVKDIAIATGFLVAADASNKGQQPNNPLK